MSVLIVVFIALLSWSSLHFHKEVHSDTSIIKYLRLIFLHVNTLCMLATICLNWPLCAYVCVVLSHLQSEVTDKLRFTTFYFYFALVVCELVLCCFNEKPPLFSNVVTDPVSGTLLQTCSAESMECVCVFMLYSISCALCWLRMFNVLSSFKSQCVFWGCFVPVQASSTLTQRARLLLAAHRICPPYPCVTSLSYFLHICNIFSESLPWNHRRFSLHHNVLVVHEVGLRCTQHPQTHTLLYAWWFALITVNSNRSFVVVLLNCSVLINKLEK